jgi:tetratricopeptide (TPR) repeat protein
MRRHLSAAGLDWTGPLPAPPPSLPPGSLRAVLAEARKHALFKRYPEAIAAFSKALDLGGEKLDLWRERGETYYDAKKFVDAIQDFERIQQLAPKALYSDPDDTNFYHEAIRDLATEHAEHERWAEAHQQFTKVHDLDPEGLWDLLPLARCCLAKGDAAGYRQHCAQLQAALKKISSYYDADLAWTLVLAPGVIMDFPLVMEHVRAIAVRHPAGCPFETRLTGALRYRAGEYEEAAKQLKLAVAAQDEPAEIAAAWCFLAMAQHQLQQPDEARKALAEAGKQLKEIQGAQLPGGGKSPVAWHQLLDLRLLHQEAETLLGPRPPAPNP